MRRPVHPRNTHARFSHLCSSYSHWCVQSAAAVLIAGAAQAQVLEQSFHAVVPSNAAPYEASVDMPAFDPMMGTLVEVRVELTPHFVAALRAENTDAAAPQMATMVFTAGAMLKHKGTTLVSGQTNGYMSHFLMPFDGTLDFAGISGMSQMVHDDQTTVASILPSSPEFECFAGAPNGNASLHIDVEVLASPQCEPFGVPTIEFCPRISNTPELTLVYRYTASGQTFCAGDGTAGTCPCNNSGFAGHGCASPASSAGAMLQASGDPAVSADTFTLLVNDLPPTTVITLMQADAQFNVSGAFGAGLSCMTGSVMRIATHVVAGSDSMGGTVGDMSIAVVGAIPPLGGTRLYQMAYREVPGACNAATVNFSNGWRVTWRP
jgi:hypothetical protein